MFFIMYHIKIEYVMSVKTHRISCNKSAGEVIHYCSFKVKIRKNEKESKIGVVNSMVDGRLVIQSRGMDSTEWMV